MAKQFTIDARDFIEALCDKMSAGTYREGVSGGQDPTFWSTRTCFIYYAGAGPEEEQVYLLTMNQSWGTEIKLTWLAPLTEKRGRNRPKINAYCDPQWDHNESRPLTQEHFNLLMNLMVNRDTQWMRSRPLTVEERDAA